jgi:hypothetical protein
MPSSVKATTPQSLSAAAYSSAWYYHTSYTATRKLVRIIFGSLVKI